MKKGLPPGWVAVSLGEAWNEARDRVHPTQIQAAPYLGLEHIASASSEVHGQGSSAEVKSTVAVFSSGDVLYGRLRPYLNKVTRPSFDGVASTEFLVFKEAAALANPFLKYLLSSSAVVSHAHSGSAGVSLPRVSAEVLGRFEIGLPPLPEQHRIVAKLEELFSELDAGVSALERVQAKLERYRASVLKSAVEGSLTEQWRKENPPDETGEELLQRILAERRRRWIEEQLATFEAKGRKPPKNWKDKYKEPARPDTRELPELPERWCWGTVDQLTCLVTSGSRGWARYYSECGDLFIRAQDINTDKLKFDHVARVALPKGAEGSRTLVEAQDVLVTITGANVTKTARISTHLGTAYVSQHVGLLRPVAPELAAYLYTWIIAPAGGRRRLEAAAYGAGKPGLNLTNLRELPVAIPPATEARRIVDLCDLAINAVGQGVDAIASQVHRSLALRQSVLKRAFEGRLVPQHPDDEPASVLLDRIRAEREATKPKKKRATKKPKAKKGSQDA